MGTDHDITNAAVGSVSASTAVSLDPGAADLSPALLEALLVVQEGALPAATVAAALDQPVEGVVTALTALAEEYERTGRGFRLRETAVGWRLYAAPEYQDLLQKVVLDQQPARLSPAALETLAVVAYRQPVSRAAVAAIRGVSADGVMRTLASRGLIEEVGTEASTGALLYATTTFFLERIGLHHLDELPPLAPYLPDIESVESFTDRPSI